MKKFAIMIVFMCCGCVPQDETTTTPVHTYQVERKSPNGDIVDSWKVKGYYKPRIRTEWGGQTFLICSDGTKIQAPTGWLLTCERTKE